MNPITIWIAGAVIALMISGLLTHNLKDDEVCIVIFLCLMWPLITIILLLAFACVIPYAIGKGIRKIFMNELVNGRVDK